MLENSAKNQCKLVKKEYIFLKFVKNRYKVAPNVENSIYVKGLLVAGQQKLVSDIN